ncbi:alternative ribosome rescue aminoacyl-tRNA hydrolase ArfB [Polycladidibacter hongkongensis]|uniref:alternative ribosome rescue aminoacyl-tRNA hydrolase ArfB n=1 Tax=Polycladidibacter hongkongensis TaxID=1647556 RepID=UPI00082A6101|nr:alternative ribosome rescue aminoacyl-tRNA hydrolase ArfB [Pseudovibrio hongkongensis]
MELPKHIHVQGAVYLPKEDLREDFVRATGPGGQNVNKVSSAVQLRFALERNTSLPEHAKTKLVKIAGSRLTKGGEVVLFADRFRTQERNRQDALERLLAMLREALFVPKTRRATKPTKASQRRRLDTKKKHGQNKKLRAQRSFD